MSKEGVDANDTLVHFNQKNLRKKRSIHPGMLSPIFLKNKNGKLLGVFFSEYGRLYEKTPE